MGRTLAYFVGLCLVVGLIHVAASPAEAQASCTAAWAPGTFYSVNTQVGYNGRGYRCQQAHTSQVGWEPSNVPALWVDQGACGSATPTATARPRATATTPPTTATATTRPRATATSTTPPRATATSTTPPRATATSTTRPRATSTSTPRPTITSTPRPTNTAPPTATHTPTATTPPGSGCDPAWSASAAYSGGARVSRTCGGSTQNYQANYWTQNNDPCTNSGPAGSGEEWAPLGSCGVATPTTAPRATATATGPAPTTPPSGPRRYVGYSSTWNTSIYDLTIANIPSYVTHLNLAFARPDTAYVRGSFEFDQAVAGFEFVEGAATNSGQKKFTAQQKQDLRNNITALRNRGTQVFVSVGGWSYSQGDQWSRFNANNVVGLALDLGATGVDIDWESSGSSCTQSVGAISCTKDGEIANIITNLYNARQGLQISIAGWSTGAYYIKGSPFEEGKVQWGSPFGGTMYNVVKNHGSKLTFINLMSYDGGEFYDPREGYESYKAIYAGPINIGIEIAPEGAGGATLKMTRDASLAYDQDMLTGLNNMATPYYNVQTAVDYIRGKGRANDGMMIWQIWKERVHAPAPSGAASVNSAGQYICQRLPLSGNCSDAVPNLPKLTP